MKYGGKYSLKSWLLREFDEMDVNWGYGTDMAGEVTPEFIAGEKKRRKEAGYTEEETEEYLDDIKAKQAKKQNMSSQEFKEFQKAHMSEYDRFWEEYGPEVAEINSTKKVETYRDLKLVLHSMTVTEKELKQLQKIYKRMGWTSVVAMAGFKICKHMLAKVTGLKDALEVAGVAKDIGETAIEMVGAAMADIPPKKAKSNPLSDALTLHKDYSTIIDPELEQDMFRELIRILEDMEELGQLDKKIPEEESSFTEFAEAYIENDVGSDKVGIHGAKAAGDTAKLTDINVPDLSMEQQEYFYEFLASAASILSKAHEAI